MVKRLLAGVAVAVALAGMVSLIGSMLLLGHSYAVSTLGSAWFSHLESVLLLDGTRILTGVIFWSIAMLFYGGIPVVAGLLLWWITIRVDRQAQSSIPTATGVMPNVQPRPVTRLDKSIQTSNAETPPRPKT